MGSLIFLAFGHTKEGSCTKNEGDKVQVFPESRWNTENFLGVSGNDPSPTGVVRDLVSRIPKGNHIFYADSWFGSLDLAETLQREGRYFVLMCRANRPSWLWSDWLNVGLKKGESAGAKRKDKTMNAVSLKDRKAVNILTNVASSKIVRTRNNKEKPEAVQNYSAHMNALDRFDRQHTLYLMRHRRRKWTRAYLYSMIKFAVHNARLLWNHSHSANETYTLLEFLCELVDAMAPSGKRYFFFYYFVAY